MRLSDWEEQRLLIFTAAELARRHLAAGLKLNAPEAIAFICDAMFEAARAGSTYEETDTAGRTALAPDQVMDGVADLVDEVRLEVMLGDGTRLLFLRHPLGRSPTTNSDTVDLPPPPAPPPRDTQTLTVTNSGKRVIRISSHFPFDQVNQRLVFDRDGARGFHLDLPSGETLRWAPGETHEVTLIRYGGDGQ